MGDEEKKRRILIMDDEEMVGEIAIHLFKYIGYDAVHVKDGEEAVRKYVEQQNQGEGFDFVIMDLSIPGGMGGKEAVGEILAIDRHAKVLVSSGYSTDPVMMNFDEYGFVGAVPKPFDLMTIRKTFESLSQ
ncbi:response regulator [Desulfomarina sp.]